MILSPAFKGCSTAYAEVHLSGARCLDGAPHRGAACLLTDEARAAEAKVLLTTIPAAAHGAGVVLGVDGAPALSSELPNTPTDCG